MYSYDRATCVGVRTNCPTGIRHGLPHPVRLPMLMELVVVGAVNTPREFTRMLAFGKAPAIALRFATPCAVGITNGFPVSSPLVWSHCDPPKRNSLFLT